MQAVGWSRDSSQNNTREAEAQPDFHVPDFGIKLYFGMENAIKKSGIGRAFYHQKKALTLNNIEFTTDKNDLDYDILHINTIYPDSISMIKQARENNKKIIYHAHST